MECQLNRITAVRYPDRVGCRPDRIAAVRHPEKMGCWPDRMAVVRHPEKVRYRLDRIAERNRKTPFMRSNKLSHRGQGSTLISFVMTHTQPCTYCMLWV